VQNSNDVAAWHLFLLFPSGAFFCLFKGRRVGIGSLTLSDGGFFFTIRGILGGKKFVAHIGPNGYFTFSPPPI
jgi:hypothetical protein